jgi:hypothetical protein
METGNVHSFSFQVNDDIVWQPEKAPAIRYKDENYQIGTAENKRSSTISLLMLSTEVFGQTAKVGKKFS